jgi:hypothetical protein
MFKRSIVLALVLVQTFSLHAEVLLQGTSVSTLDYRAALKADPDAEAPSDVYLKSRPLGSRRDELMEKLAAAQRAFVDDSRAQAIEKFRELTALLSADDWGSLDRGVFVQAYLRLAQLETDPVRQREYLAHSLAAGEAVPEPSMFPPPLLRARELLAAELPKVSLSVSAKDGWTMVLVNGRPCRPGKCYELPATSTPVRVTYLSDQWIPFTATVPAREAGSVKPKRVAWYEGSCGDLKFHPEVRALGARRTVCERPARELNLRPSSGVIAKTGQDGGEIARLDLKRREAPFYKNPWFWTGVGVAVVAALVVNSRTHEEKEPTTTYGAR